MERRVPRSTVAQLGALAWSLALAASTAAAAPRAVELDLRVSLGGFQFEVAGSGIAEVSSDGVHVVALTVPEGVVATSGAVFPATDPAVFPIRGVQITARNGAGTFAETAGGKLTGAMPIQGVAKVCLFEPCSSAPANVSLPLSVVGVGGTAAGAGPVSVTLRGAPWTAGTAALVPGYLSTFGLRHGPGSATSTTAQPGGELLLVTPIVVSTNIGVGVTIPAFGFLDLRFAPEPGAAPLALASALALAALGRAHRRRA
jgi:hypothetical protein